MWCSTISTVLPSSACTDADQLDELRDVLHRHAGHRLVEQEHARVGRRAAWRARACACRRARGARPARRPGRPARRGRSPTSRRSTASRDARLPAARSASSRRSPPRQPAERSRAPTGAGTRSTPGTSCRARHARGGTAGSAVMSTPSSSTLPLVGRCRPGDEVEERRLAGPVRADHGEQFALADLEPDIGDDGCAADVEPEVPGCEDRGCAHALTSASSLQPFIATIGGAVSYGDAVPSTLATRCRSS